MGAVPTTARALVAGFVLLHSVVQCDSVQGQTKLWQNSGNGAWTIAANWSPVGIPTAVNFAAINNGGTTQISAAGAVASGVALGGSTNLGGRLELLNAPAALSVTGSVTVGGNQSGGVLSILDGSRLTSASGNVDSNSTDVSSHAIVDGPDSNWEVSGNIRLAGRGTSTLRILNGGAVSNASATVGGSHDVSVSMVTVDGLNSIWTNSGQVFVDGIRGLSLLDVVNGGQVTAADGLSIGMNGILTGNSRVIGAVTNAGTVAPGTSSATLIIEGPYTQTDTAKLQIDIASNTSFDKLDIRGAFAFDGVLEVSLMNGYIPAAGRQFNLLDWTGSRSGTFSALLLPTLPAPRQWNVSRLYSTGVLSVFVPTAGDFDKDGAVRAADLNQWKGDFGLNGNSDADGDGDSDGADFLTWQRTFGGEATSTALSAPEPIGLVWAVAVFAPLALTRRRVTPPWPPAGMRG